MPDKPILQVPVLQINVPDWVARAENDPVTYFQRQAAEITLNTIALTSPLNKQLVLKGGTLMGLAYGSPRQTSDIDLTSTVSVDAGIDQRIKSMLDKAFPNVASRLGYIDIVMRTHSVKKKPKPAKFEDKLFPALELKIGYAVRGTKGAATLFAGKPINSIFKVDISFNEPLQQMQILSLSGGGDLLAYHLTDLVSEKFRAMLQQVVRNRNRRQDVYDLKFLIEHDAIKDADKAKILESLRIKARSRSIEPTAESLDNQEVRDRAAKDWHTMALEVGDIPDFNAAYVQVTEFYRSLPW